MTNKLVQNRLTLCLTIILTLYGGIMVSAQIATIQGQKIDYIYPSAESMALIKAIERQPSISNGTPDISIPIYSVPNMNFQIKLTYNASGIHMDELPTSAGLGWRLETGGTITRVVVGLPDDYPVNGYLNRPLSINDYASKPLSEYTNGDIIHMDPNYYDNGPDIFYYEILGIKGKFVLDRNGEVYCYPRSNLKITYERNYDKTIKLFRAKFANGDEEIFNIIEKCWLTGNTNITSWFASTWRASHVKTNNSTLISFNYGGISYYTENRKYEDIQVQGAAINGCSSSLTYTAKFQVSVLRSISSINSDIYLDYDAKSSLGFASIQPNYCWEYIRDIGVSFKNDLYGQNNMGGNSFTFKYDNMTNAAPSRGEFVLTGVDQCFAGDNMPYKLPYTFSYYSPNSIPGDIGEKSRDLWGYYNGEPTGSIVPSIYDANGKITSIPINGLTPLMNGANRSASEAYCKYGTLKSITNPEGLTTEYDYELNSFLFQGYTVNGGGLRVKSIKRLDGTTLVNQVNYSYLTDGATTSGVLLFHPINVIGVDPNSDPSGKYIFAKYHGVGFCAYSAPLFYSRIVESTNNLGSTIYNYELPVERTNTSIVPSEYSWFSNPLNSKYLSNENDEMQILNDSDPTVPTLFNLWTGPLLTGVVNRNQSGVIVKETTYAYGNLEHSKVIHGLYFYPSFVTVLPPNPEGEPVVRYILTASKVYHLSAWRELKKKNEMVYSVSGTNGIGQSLKLIQVKPSQENDRYHYSFLKREQKKDATGESIIKRYKYCFEDDLIPDPSIEYQDSLLEQCLLSYESVPENPTPSRPTAPSGSIADCYTAYDYQVRHSISDDAKAVSRLREMGNYSNPIEEITMIDRSGSKTVIDAKFSTYTIRPNQSVLPLTSYKLKTNVDSSLFVGLKVSKISNINQLEFDNSLYKSAKEITLYSTNNEVLEYKDEKNVFTANIWNWDGSYPLLSALNCRYSAIQSYVQDQTDELAIRASNPQAMITTKKYLSPFGVISETNPRGRTTYSVYNSMGDIVAIKDHDKNIKRIAVKRFKNQIGTALIESDPDGDLNLLDDDIISDIQLSVVISGQLTIAGTLSYSQAFDYTINYGDSAGDIPLLSPVFQHQYTTSGTYTITVKCKHSGTILDEESRTVTLTGIPSNDPDIKLSVAISGQLTISGTLSYSQAFEYTINYGDGAGDIPLSSPTFQHQYNANGIYTITVKCKQSGTILDEESKTVTLDSDIQLNVINTGHLTVTGALFYKSTYVYTINYGDGAGDIPLSSSMFEHQYTARGTYTVTVKCKYSGITLDEESMAITLQAYPLSVIFNYFFIPIGSGTREQSYSFPGGGQDLDIVVSPRYGGCNYTASWNITFTPFGSGTSQSTQDSEQIVGCNAETSRNFSYPGDYRVTLTITDGTETITESWYIWIRTSYDEI